MSKRILFCATHNGHFTAFHEPCMRWFQQQGWEVHVAARDNGHPQYCDRHYDIAIQRSPFGLRNLLAYQQLSRIIRANHYDLIHCHTPVGGALTRIAARASRHLGTKVLYTAHGFHFYTGASLLNWLLYYPVEWYLAHITDCLITINNEDYCRASRKLPVQRVVHVHGVGIDTCRFAPVSPQEKAEIRRQAGYSAQEILLIYVAELNRNKNQQLLLQVLRAVARQAPAVRLLLVGEGERQDYYRRYAARLGVTARVDFLGFRNDVAQLLPMCDIAVASSLREGLPVNVMEAMACGLPIVATANRGHTELVTNAACGWVVPSGDVDGFAEKILALCWNMAARRQLGENGRRQIERNYTQDYVMRELQETYAKVLPDNQYTFVQGVKSDILARFVLDEHGDY